MSLPATRPSFVDVDAVADKFTTAEATWYAAFKARFDAKQRITSREGERLAALLEEAQGR